MFIFPFLPCVPFPPLLPSPSFQVWCLPWSIHMDSLLLPLFLHSDSLKAGINFDHLCIMGAKHSAWPIGAFRNTYKLNEWTKWLRCAQFTKLKENVGNRKQNKNWMQMKKNVMNMLEENLNKSWTWKLQFQEGFYYFSKEQLCSYKVTFWKVLNSPNCAFTEFCKWFPSPFN